MENLCGGGMGWFLLVVKAFFFVVLNREILKDSEAKRDFFDLIQSVSAEARRYIRW
jgi:hypothetical protein